jgi:hypothetical protein
MPKDTTASPPQSAPSAEHRQLAIFVGTWNLEGRQYAGRVGEAAEITGVERYEWLPGGFFLVHHFDSQVGSAQAACIEVTGYDPSTRTYPTQTYYNTGQRADWRLIERDETWILTGQWDMGGELVQVRCTIEFGEEGSSKTSKWESSSNSVSWEAFWEVRAKRA